MGGNRPAAQAGVHGPSIAMSRKYVIDVMMYEAESKDACKPVASKWNEFGGDIAYLSST
jgi:hypothetical protein